MTKYDMRIIRMLLSDGSIDKFFFAATNEKAIVRFQGSQKRKSRNQSGSKVEVEGVWTKYKRGFLALDDETL